MLFGCCYHDVFLPVRPLKNSLSASQNLWSDLSYMWKLCLIEGCDLCLFFFLFQFCLPHLKFEPLAGWNNQYLRRQLPAVMHLKKKIVIIPTNIKTHLNILSAQPMSYSKGSSHILTMSVWRQAEHVWTGSFYWTSSQEGSSDCEQRETKHRHWKRVKELDYCSSE